MKQHYNINWLIRNYENGINLKFIYFWGNTNKYNEDIGKFCFSQWHESEFTVNDVVFKTSEHWMMAQKALLFKDLDNFEKIICSESPKIAKEIGRQVKNFNEEIWDAMKYKIVVAGNIHKFVQNESLKDFLLNTNDRIIVEASPVDTVWGIGLTQDSKDIDNPYLWRGENLLGFALMEVREYLNKFKLDNLLDSTLLPPWLVFPEFDQDDMFWRMGKGEDYLYNFTHKYLELSSDEKFFYTITYIEPHNWLGFYEDF